MDENLEHLTGLQTALGEPPSIASTKPKRLRSLITRDEYNPAPKRQKAFTAVLNVYLRNRFCQPCCSSLAWLDKSLRPFYRRWSVDSCICAVDIELAVEKALDGDRGLLAKWWVWFVLPEIEPSADRAILTAEESRTYSRIVQRCGREFIRRGLYPIQKYFHAPARIKRREMIWTQGAA